MGYSLLSDNTTYHPYVFSGGTMYDLTTLLPPAAAANWVLSGADAINDSGQIAGWGKYNGAGVGFLLTPALPGDANLEGRVDVNDLTVVLTNFGRTSTTWSQGDFNGDGKVDVNDLTILLTHFGQSATRRA